MILNYLLTKSNIDKLNLKGDDFASTADTNIFLKDSTKDIATVSIVQGI